MKRSARKASGRRAFGRRASRKKASGRRASRKKAPARKRSKKASGRKASGHKRSKKVSGRKSSRKKAPARKRSKKASGRRASGRKSSRKKASGRRASGRKSSRKKAPARKRSKKASGRRASRKKASGRRASRKKVASKSKKDCVKKWRTLEHNGVIFPEPYKYLGLDLIYDGKKVKLNEAAEEAAMFYAKILHLDHSTNPVFRKNFFNDWKKLLPRGSEIKSLEKCDFKEFVKHFKRESDARKQQTRRQKTKQKEEKERIEAKYKYAKVNGEKQPVGNFRVEPPGLFLGRGAHPKAGKIKNRIQPEDIIINIGKAAKIPDPPEGHQWGSIINDECLVWLASWKENINNDTKYVWLGQDSDIKKKSDEDKFELARKLKRNFSKIRKTNMENIMISGSSKDSEKLNQLAVAVYLIDTLLLRVGNEKGSDEADTVGVSSLRVEHIKLEDNYNVTLDFLGKDSVQFKKTFKVPSEVHNLLSQYTKHKTKDKDLFNLITAKDINNYLKELMPGLSAKVFRTANASNLFQNELDKIKIARGTKPSIMVSKMNDANTQVAVLCNHKKKVSKNYDKMIDKINEQIKTAKDKVKELEAKNQTAAVKERVKKEKEKEEELKAKLKNKKNMKDVAIGTSKINYIDPRITVAFGKKHDIDITKLFNAQQRKKFSWAFDVDGNWKF